MEEVKFTIEEAIKKLYDVEVEADVTLAPEDTGADYATNVAMKLTKVVGKAPRMIAEEIKAKAEELFDGWKVEIAGPGFLNFISPDEYFVEKVAEIAEKQRTFARDISPDEYEGKMVIAEFSDPNPFKVLHVGHLYTSVVGDAISRMIETAGGKVIRANFGGDVGLHVAKTMFALRKAGRGVDELTIEGIAAAYVEGTRAYEEDEAAHQEIVELNKEIYWIALEDDHEGELAEMYWKGRELSYQYFRDFYAKIGVKFDRYYPESTVAMRGLKEVKAGLAQGVYEESDGAVVYKGEKKGLHTRVFINKNGLPTYEAKDVGLLFTKWDDWQFDESVVITGNDIIEYMKVVLASVGEMAPQLAERTTHLTHGQVKLLGNEKMSSRKGNFLKAVDVLEMVKERLARAAVASDAESVELSGGSESAASEEVSGVKVDSKVVMAAVKYAFLKYKIGGDIIFDPEESVSTTGNSGVYLLYSAVRAMKILEKCQGEKKFEEGEKDKVFVKRLAKKILEYRGVLKEAAKEKAPNKICTYLYELAQEFSRFYENVKVAGSEKEAELARVVLAYYLTMEHGLNLLGIKIPKEM